MHLLEARLQRAQQIFVVADLQVGMQSALQQNAGAAELQHLFDFLVDGFKRKDVAVFSPQRAVERAERAVLGAEVGVVDVAIDLVSDHARVVLGQAHLMRLHADADQVVGLEHVDRLLFGQAHGVTSILAENGPKVGMSENLKGLEFLATETPRHRKDRKQEFWLTIIGGTPPVFRMCGRERTCGRAFLYVWQRKDLEADFLYVWYPKELMGSADRKGERRRRKSNAGGAPTPGFWQKRLQAIENKGSDTQKERQEAARVSE
jgi:hypothetical protein